MAYVVMAHCRLRSHAYAHVDTHAWFTCLRTFLCTLPHACHAHALHTSMPPGAAAESHGGGPIYSYGPL